MSFQYVIVRLERPMDVRETIRAVDLLAQLRPVAEARAVDDAFRDDATAVEALFGTLQTSPATARADDAEEPDV